MSLKPRIQGILTAGFLLAVALSVKGQLPTSPVFLARAQKAFDLASKNYQAATNSNDAAQQMARMSFEAGELAANDPQRADFARRGIEVCHAWLEREPKSGPAHYYLAANLGELAQAESPSIASYKLVHEMEREFIVASELDMRFDYAGPARTLGELYSQAPFWPLSVGNKRKAHEWLERAAALAPGYPDNQLNLAEAQLKWREHDALKKTLKNLAATWPAARTNLTGEAWEPNWQDWNARRTALLTDVQKIYGGK